MPAHPAVTKRHRAVTIGLHSLIALVALAVALSAFCIDRLTPEPAVRVIRDVQVEYVACED